MPAPCPRRPLQPWQFARRVALIAGLAVSLPASADAGPAATTAAAHSHMPESLRASLASVVVIGSAEPTEEEMTGTYEEVTPGLYGGIAQGSRMASPSAQVGMVTVSFPIPILMVPGAIFGGISGKAKQDLQRLRDAMADDLANADNQPLTNDGLALDVYWNLQRLTGLESALLAPTATVPEEARAILFVSIANVTFDVEDEEAILTTTAELTLRQRSDDKALFRRSIQYQDRDTLANWTRDDNALWRDYANFARHYLAREIAAETFGRIELNNELLPAGTDTAKPARKNDWQLGAKSGAPTLAWSLDLHGGNDYGPWADAIDESVIDYDIEVYDRKRLVYSQKQVPEPSHTLVSALEPCKTYWWSVRPVYRVGGSIRFGDWMRKASEPGKYDVDGLTGRNASQAPAYIQDFATLEVSCR